ncbi:MAG: saccharopine dehydrogenase C-terminal domain-containing protein [Actinomycetota bacterium]
MAVSRTLVLGAGIVGSAAVWDLTRRGHDVTVADVDERTASTVGKRFDADSARVDATDDRVLRPLLAGFDAIVSAVPFRHGHTVASAAIDAGVHYVDFGGNPTVVTSQLELDTAAGEAGVLVAPDCGLAPGLANVMAQHLVETASGTVRSVQMRVGALPREPVGVLGYQLAFSPAGLINEYAEPCEVLEDGRYRSVDSLTRFEDVAWDTWGPLEAFSTAGGTSTMCIDHEGSVEHLEYKTLRFPGHGRIFAAFRELGLFDETGDPSPRSVLIDALDRALPRSDDDLVLVRVWIETDEATRTLAFENVHDGTFSALARTTAFPATALIDLVARGEADQRGVRPMHLAIDGATLFEEIAPVGIRITGH